MTILIIVLCSFIFWKYWNDTIDLITNLEVRRTSRYLGDVLNPFVVVAVVVARFGQSGVAAILCEQAHFQVSVLETERVPPHAQRARSRGFLEHGTDESRLIPLLRKRPVHVQVVTFDID